MRRLFAVLAAAGLLAVLCLAGPPSRAQSSPAQSSPAQSSPAESGNTPDAALKALLDKVRSAMPGVCSQANADRLAKILCSKTIRIGVRKYYPLFGEGEGDKSEGYEPDIGLEIGRMLGVEVDFVRVNAATRIPLLAEDRIDLVIATMGHNTQRDGQVRFIRPHYYRSETIIVGPRGSPVAGMSDLAGRTVCVTIGNLSNASMVSQGARLMLFDEAGVLPERLKDQTCSLAAQDDSFFAYYFTDPDFAAGFAAKFGFSQVPWGMAVARQGSDELGRALDLISQIFHRDGVFLKVAREHRIGTGFLEEQQKVWGQPACNTDSGSTNPDCVLPPLNAALQPTPFAGDVSRFEKWLDARADIELSLPMLKTAPAWTVFKEGVANSLILIAGALVATLLLAIVFGVAMASRVAPVRWLARFATVTLQSSPIVLTLVIAAAIVHAFFVYSDALALTASIAALGLANGSNAGQALSEAMWSLRHENAPPHGTQLFSRALGRSATQIVAFLINAAKGTPIASFIGAPELLSALTDITSFSSGRATTYTLLLVFYTVVVMVVVWLCDKFRVWLESRQLPMVPA
jgi:ABC-type amino acid transport substrate-binding protein/ABC-type amino acid transport system permease subunit